MSEMRFEYLADLSPDALRQLAEQWRQQCPDCGLLMLAPEAQSERLPALQAVCLELSITLAGGVFPALIQDNAFTQQGAWLLRLPPAARRTIVGPLEGNSSDSAEQIAAWVAPQLGTERQSLLMIFDAQIPDITSILDALYLKLGDAVAYFGVNAGSETFQPMPCVFDNRELHSNSVLCVMLPESVRATLHHGYQAPDTLVTATSTVANRIDSIDWEPAFDVYRKLVENHYAIHLTPENFYEYAVHFPFGILLANGQTLVRIPVGLGDDGAIICVGEIPPNSMLTLLEAPQPGSLQTAQTITARARADSDSDQALLFYCAGRRMHLGEAAEQELSALAQTSERSLGGALSLGEIGSFESWAYPLFHNAALVLVTWPDK